jgi:Uma2 family endonuclease
MSTARRLQPLTFEDFCSLVKDGQKADLIDGVIYMASPDNTDAGELFLWLATLMNLFVRARKLGKVYGNRVAFRLDDSGGPEPDIGFVQASRLHLVRRGFVQGPPDLAVEIVSPDSVERDYKKKRDLYEKAGVSEYWIVDEMKQKVILLRLDGGGKYRSVRANRGVLRSEVLPGFRIRLAWLWQEPLPLETEILAELLASGE